FIPLAILAIAVAARFPQIPFVFLFFLICAAIPLGASRLFARLFTRADGGLIRLERSVLYSGRGAILRSSNSFAVAAASKFEIVDTGGDENTLWTLQFVTDGRAKGIAYQSDLPLADLKWLNRQLNAWLGWTFPAHCLACGRALETQDV